MIILLLFDILLSFIRIFTILWHELIWAKFRRFQWRVRQWIILLALIFRLRLIHILFCTVSRQNLTKNAIFLRNFLLMLRFALILEFCCFPLFHFGKTRSLGRRNRFAHLICLETLRIHHFIGIVNKLLSTLLLLQW